MLIYALVICDSPWNQSYAGTVYYFLQVLILYEIQHIISKILKVKNRLAREKMIAHGSSAWDLPYVLKKNLFSFSNTQGLYGFHLIKWKAYKEKEVEWGFKIYILQGLITGSGNWGWSGSEQVGQGFNSHPEGKVCIWVVCSNNSLALEFNTRYSSKIKSKPHSARQQAQGGTWLYDRHTWKAGERK